MTLQETISDTSAILEDAASSGYTRERLRELQLEEYSFLTRRQPDDAQDAAQHALENKYVEQLAEAMQLWCVPCQRNVNAC